MKKAIMILAMLAIMFTAGPATTQEAVAADVVVGQRDFQSRDPNAGQGTQKTNMEGGVVSIFVKRKIEGNVLKIFGDGTQTRDLLYVEDCAEFIYQASTSDACVGETLNAGTGHDITINDLASLADIDSMISTLVLPFPPIILSSC